jgi:uncharacterized protein (TIGR00288 family)
MEGGLLLLIDSQNLFYSLRDMVASKDGRLDFLKLREIVCRKSQCSFVHAVVYFSVLREDLTQLQEFLIYNGFEVPTPLYNRDVDSTIIVDALKYAVDYDIVVLASGDSDFIPLLRDLKEKGKTVGVIAFAESMSPQLERIADWTIRLDSRIVLDKKLSEALS